MRLSALVLAGALLPFAAAPACDAPMADERGWSPADEGAHAPPTGETEALPGVVVQSPGEPAGPLPARIVMDVGAEVPPVTVAQLGVEDAEGVSYRWRVSQPAGSRSVFTPSETAAAPRFELNVVGAYTFELETTDALGRVSYADPVDVYVVTGDDAIVVELLWDTPGDPNQSDEGRLAGADVDLHLLRPGAAEEARWYDVPGDAFWFNPQPEWGQTNDWACEDDPSLDRDDTDGAGPETMSLACPAHGEYRIGVHYWNAHGFGASHATVRVYVYGTLVAEMADVVLEDRDLWNVGTIAWPLGEFTLATTDDGALDITAGYVHEGFPTDN